MAPLGTLGDRLVVRDHDQGAAALAVDPLQQVEHAHRALAVEVSGRLIGQDQARVVDQRPADRHPLPLTTAQLARPVLGTSGEPDLVQQRQGEPAVVRRR